MLGSRVTRPRPQPIPTRRSTPARSRPARATVKPTQLTTSAALSSRRPLLLLMVMVMIAGALVSRLVFWQLMQHARLAAAAAKEQNRLLVQPALRGQIFDAAGTPLATDVTLDLVYAVPKAIKDRQRSAALLSPVLHVPAQYLEDKLGTFSIYEQLAASVSPAQSRQIQKLSLPGVFLTPMIRREYPEGQEASQVLGYTDLNGVGQYGLESYYNNLLSGRAGIRSALKDTAGNQVQLSSGPTTAPHDGANLYLSLDSFVQNAVETELQKAVKLHSALGGTIIVMDPKTGYILGMASTPTYNPNHYPASAGTLSPHGDSLFENPATSWNFEPGSTFKVVTMGAGLDAHVITPDTAFVDTGSWTVGDTTLHNWNLRGNGWETMTQVLQHSANVGASFVSSRLGVTRFYKYVQRFGIGQPTGIDLANEESGLVPLPGDKNWTIVNQFTNSFGQGLATTPIQLARAVSAVANGGVMMRPQIVKRIVYGNQVIEQKPISQGRVISAQSSHLLTGMLVKSAIAGEAQLALIKGYNIAAKTGTANIAAATGGYVPGATIASTVAYAPAYHPRFVALVILDRPHDQPWGSLTAAPVIHDLFQDLFMYYHIPPSPHALNR